VPVSGCWAEGVGIRGTARGGEGAPNPVLGWWVEAADQRRACAPSVVPDVHLPQGQRDELSAVLRALTAGTGRADEAIERLSRSPHWGWVALDPTRTW